MRVNLRGEYRDQTVGSIALLFSMEKEMTFQQEGVAAGAVVVVFGMFVLLGIWKFLELMTYFVS